MGGPGTGAGTIPSDRTLVAGRANHPPPGTPWRGFVPSKARLLRPVKPRSPPGLAGRFY